MALSDAQVFEGDGTTRDFTILGEILSESHVRVWIDDVIQSSDDWDLLGSTVIFDTAPNDGVNIQFLVSTTGTDFPSNPSAIGDVSININDVITVAANLGIISTTSTNINDVVTVASNIDAVNEVASNKTNIDNVVNNKTNIDTVATDISNINIVATDISNVINVSNNIEEVKILNTAIEDGVLPFERIVITVNNIDELLEVLPSNGDTVIVKDLNRGGTFIYDATQSAVNNGGTVFDGWVRQYSGVVNAKWFGAKGDGVTDDSIAFSNVYSFVNPKQRIFVPFGNYNITTFPANTKDVVWYIDDGLFTSDINLLNLPSTKISSLSLWDDATSNQYGSVRYDRIANYSGGVTGNVATALNIKTTTSAGAKNFEWALLSALDNSSTLTDATENVAIYGQASKKSNGKTWAGCFEINDTYNAYGVGEGDTIGIEVTVRPSEGSADTNFQRIGVHVAGHSTAMSEWGRAYYASGNNIRYREVYSNAASFSKAVFFNAGIATETGENSALMRDTGTSSYGINLKNATYTSNIALALKSGHKISFEETQVVTQYFNGSSLVFSGVECLFVKGIAINSSGNISSTATAGVSILPSNPNGFINIKIDGETYKIPYYGA